MSSSRLGTMAAVLVVAGPALAWFRVVPPLAGFGLYALGGLTAVGVGLWSVIRALRGRGIGGGGVLAIAVGVVFVMLALRRGDAPRINDFTTDLADPPVFVHAATLPGNSGRDMSYPVAFAEVQRGCCSDLQPAHLKVPPAAALASVQQAAARMPDWTVTQVDVTAGTLEAVATSRLFHFQDDVVVRVRPEGDASSRVDVRSKSRDGKGDLGANAARIRLFMATMSPPNGTP
jgi:uncharacterized protein (DUF1499 family)